MEAMDHQVDVVVSEDVEELAASVHAVVVGEQQDTALLVGEDLGVVQDTTKMVLLMGVVMIFTIIVIIRIF